MENQVVTKVGFATLCFSLLVMPVFLKNLFISSSQIFIWCFYCSRPPLDRCNVGIIISIVIRKKIRIPSSDLLFQLVFVINFRVSHTLLNVVKILIKTEKNQRNILPINKKPWICGLIFSVGKILPFCNFWD